MPRKSVPTTCAHCAEVRPIRPGRHYCSKSCGSFSRPRIARTSSCLNCGKETKIYPSRDRANVGQFCGKICHDIHQRRRQIRRSCQLCGSPVKPLPPSVEAKLKHRYCSKACSRKALSLARQGRLNVNWRGGSSNVRAIPGWITLAKRMKKRDNMTCQDCGEQEKRLLVHHIWPWTQGGSPTDEANLVTLCCSCHRYRHIALEA